MAEFGIDGDSFDPDLITNRLGIVPTHILVKGKPSSSVKGRLNRFDKWFFDTGYLESLAIETQLAQLYDVFKDKVIELNILKSQFNLNYVISFIIKIRNEETPAVIFPTWFIEFLHNIQAEVSFAMYIE